MQFSVLTMLVVATAVAVDFSYFLAWQKWCGNSLPEARLQLIWNCIYSLPLYIPLIAVASMLFERRRKLRGAWYCILGICGFILWEFYVRPIERWYFGELNDAGIIAIWWWPWRVVYYRAIVALCWGLAIYGFFLANRPAPAEKLAAASENVE